MRDPFSLEAEHAVLGAMFKRPELIDSLSSDLSEDDFYYADNRQIFKAIMALNAGRAMVDVLTVATQVGRLDSDTPVLEYCHAIWNNTPSVANAEAYARIVKERAIDRQLLAAASEVNELAYGDEPTADKLAKAQAAVGAIDSKAPVAEVITAGDVMRDLVEEWQRRFDLGGEMDGLSTGLEDVDKIVQGLRPEQLVVIAGRAKMGKTTFAMNIARHNAIKAHKHVLVVSLEMSNYQLLDRMASAEGSIPLGEIRAGTAFGSYKTEISVAAKRIVESNLRLADVPGVTMSRIRSMARRQKRSTGLDLLVIDHLALVPHENRRLSILERTTENTRLAKLIAKELKIPVLLLCQLNRALESRPDKRPIPSDLRDSGSIEQDADLVMFVYRDEVYHPDTQYRGVAEIIVGLARDVEAGTAKVAYQGQYNRFVNLACDWREPEPEQKSRPYASRRGMEV